MKFILHVTNNQTQFTGISEHEDETIGLRAQGPYTPIKLTDNVLTIDYVSTKPLHPDMIAAICITAFYPFIKYSATMPYPVSQQFADSLKMDILPQHETVNGIYKAVKNITITNIDATIETYSGVNTVIAYGGGIDSTAIALLCPEFPIIHTTNCSDSIERKNVMKRFVEDHLKNEPLLVDSNCKNLCRPGGFTTFTNIFLVPLMLSSDLNIKNICCGEVLESSCLSNGTKYFPQFNPQRRNRWMRFYTNIGINIFSPIAGCSELITSKIVFNNNLSDEVLFCESREGYPCHKCTKCLRKLLELNLHGYNHDFNTFVEKDMTLFLKKRPLYFSNTLIETINNQNVPVYMKESISDLIHLNTNLFHKIYSKSFIYFPEDIRNTIIQSLLKYADIMTEEDELYLEQWNTQ